MKKKLKISVAIAIVGLIVFLGYTISSKLDHKKEVAQKIKTIPNFSFTTLENKVFTQKQLKPLPVVFVYFNSGCDYCRSETKKIKKQQQDFKDIQLIFVSYESKDNILKFAEEHQLKDQENIVFLQDKKDLFSQLFDVNTVPYIVTYNTNQQLQGKFKGATKIDAILGSLQ